MDKLKPEIWYFARCEHCLKMNGYLARDTNVNVMPDSDVTNLAERRLGTLVKEDCNHCELYTLQTIVAYKWERE